MTSPELFNDPISLACTIDEEGHTTLQRLTWQDQQHPVVAAGRQWVEEDGRHLLVETAGGTRFELLLNREDLIWRVKKVWRQEIMA